MPRATARKKGKGKGYTLSTRLIARCIRATANDLARMAMALDKLPEVDLTGPIKPRMPPPLPWVGFPCEGIPSAIPTGGRPKGDRPGGRGRIPPVA